MAAMRRMSGRWLSMSSSRWPIGRIDVRKGGGGTRPSTNRDRTVEFVTGLSEGRYEHRSVCNGQTKDVPRSSRLTTYPGWTAQGP